ncbi:MAG: fasciclin domain-containing protein [Pseudomonadota bacterium]
MSLQALFPELAASIPTADGGTLSTASDFEVLALALDAAGLTDTVAGLSDFTLFAPTDEAFANLAVSTGFTGDTSDPNAVFSAIAGTLSSLDPNGDPIPLLTQILQYHVSPDKTPLAELNGAGEVSTLFEGEGFQVTDATVVDADPDATNADIVASDIATNEGTVQVVDQVLLPIDTPVNDADPTLLNLLEESGGAPDDDATDFDLLLTALQATGLDTVVDDETAELTVFLPNDGAFVSLAQDLGYEGADEGEALQTILDASAEADPDNPLQLVTDILTYHVSPGEQDAEAVLASDTLATVNGATIGVDGTTLVDQDPDNADPTLIQTDIAASNGIAHAIDEVLLPVDIPAVDDDRPGDDEDPVVVDDDDSGFGEALLAIGLAGLVAFLVGGVAF